MAALPDKEKLLRNFTRCANWEEKYLYIIELGQRLAELNPQDRNAQKYDSWLSEPGVDRDAAKRQRHYRIAGRQRRGDR